MAMAYAVAVYHRNEASLNALPYDMVSACQSASMKFVDKVCIVGFTCPMNTICELVGPLCPLAKTPG